MDTIFDVVSEAGYLIDTATFIIVSLAFLYFFWGVATLILKSSEDEGRKEGITRLKWGLVILIIMLSIWGIFNILQRTFYLDVEPGQNLIEPL